MNIARSSDDLKARCEKEGRTMAITPILNGVTYLKDDAVTFEKRLEALAKNADADGSLSGAQVARCHKMADEARDIAEKMAAFAVELGLA
jgi:hypothetical protein